MSGRGNRKAQQQESTAAEPPPGVDNREAFEKANEEAGDWRAYCKKCGRQVRGTLATLRAHRCG